MIFYLFTLHLLFSRVNGYSLLQPALVEDIWVPLILPPEQSFLEDLFPRRLGELWHLLVGERITEV
jgi:hypothetical protein